MTSRIALAAAVCAALALPASSFARNAAGPDSLQLYEQATHIRVPRMLPLPTTRSATLRAAREWSATGTAPTLVGKNGVVMYAYGESHPEVVCAPLHACAIELLSPDTITDRSIGDSVRWHVQTATAGQRPVLIVKPVRSGLSTNLVVTTAKGRVYYIALQSDRSSFVPAVGFYDPAALVEHINRRLGDRVAQAEAKRQRLVASLGNVNPADLDYSYWTEGPKALRPVRVFSAQGHVYIQMPKSLQYRNAPALFVVGSKGGNQLVNYRVVGRYYVVDEMFREARLVLGTGSGAQVVTIHAGHKPSWWQSGGHTLTSGNGQPVSECLLCGGGKR
jgi:type IV secretion system protein TrbG